MPIGFLTPAERERLSRFPEQIPDDDLFVFFHLSDDDHRVVNQQREDSTRLDLHDLTLMLPQPFRALFLPQRADFPIGTLRQTLCYPAAPDAFSESQLREALAVTGLGHLADHFDEQHAWAQQLSGGG